MGDYIIVLDRSRMMAVPDTTQARSRSYVQHIREFENLTNAMKGDKASHEFVSELLRYGLEKMIKYDARKDTSNGLPKVGDADLPTIAVNINEHDNVKPGGKRGLASFVGIDNSKSHKPFNFM